MTQAELIAYCCGKIDGAVTERSPFPHLAILDFWPTNFYGALMTDFPHDAMFVRRGDYGMGGKTLMASRKHDDVKLYWRMVYDTLESEAVTQALCRKWGVEPSVSRCLLHKDTNGYGIAPHTDSLAKRVAYVLYCAPPGMIPIPHLGTHLLTPNCPAWPGSDLHQPWYNFEVAVTVPYQPNMFISWGRSPISYHAVDCHFAPGDAIQARLSIRGFLFDPEAELPYIFQEDQKERGVV